MMAEYTAALVSVANNVTMCYYDARVCDVPAEKTSVSTDCVSVLH